MAPEEALAGRKDGAPLGLDCSICVGTCSVGRIRRRQIMFSCEIGRLGHDEPPWNTRFVPMLDMSDGYGWLCAASRSCITLTISSARSFLLALRSHSG
jgi:hypothetical protein